MSAPLGRTIVRKHAGPSTTDTLDIAALASVEVTSEHELFPIDHVFDGRLGPGGSCWTARTPGAQTVLVRFHAPTDLASVIVESEEGSHTCSLQIDISGWSAARQGPFEAPARVLQFSPYGSSFHRETWAIAERGVTQIAIRVTPAPFGRFASLTSIIFR